MYFSKIIIKKKKKQKNWTYYKKIGKQKYMNNYKKNIIGQNKQSTRADFKII